MNLTEMRKYLAECKEKDESYAAEIKKMKLSGTISPKKILELEKIVKKMSDDTKKCSDDIEKYNREHVTGE